MKQQNLVQIKETGLESKQFQIKAGQAAFEVLSNTLYSDSILAVCRELITNAVDAVKDGGTVTVHAPNYEEPFFAVTDTGIGMTEDEIYDNYTSYFSSTKSDSNDEIGAFGLGSKSPFAYVDSFIVKSAKNGIENTFYAYKSSGAPALTKLDQKEVTYSGTQVSFDVNKQFEVFRDRIIRVLAFLSPDIINNLNDDDKKSLNITRKTLSGDIIDGSVYDNNSEFFPYLGGKNGIVMGGVRYPIDVIEIKESIKRMYPSFGLFTEEILHLANLNMHVEIGDISITPSRETVKFDQKTKATLDKNIIKLISGSLIIAANKLHYNECAKNFLLQVFTKQEMTNILQTVIESSEELSKIISNWNKVNQFLMTLMNTANQPKSQLAFVKISSYNKNFTDISFSNSIIYNICTCHRISIFSQEDFKNTKQGNLPGATKIVINNSENRRPGEFIFITNQKIAKKITEVFKKYLDIDLETYKIDEDIAKFRAEEKIKRIEYANRKKDAQNKKKLFIKAIPISFGDFSYRLKTSQYKVQKIDTETKHKFYVSVAELRSGYSLDSYNIMIGDHRLHNVIDSRSSALMRSIVNRIKYHVDDSSTTIFVVKDNDGSIETLEAAGFKNLFKSMLDIIPANGFISLINDYIKDWSRGYSINNKLLAWLEENGDDGTYFKGILDARSYHNSDVLIMSIIDSIDNGVFGDNDYSEVKALLNNILEKIKTDENLYSSINKKAILANDALNKFYTDSDSLNYIFDLIIKDCKNL